MTSDLFEHLLHKPCCLTCEHSRQHYWFMGPKDKHQPTEASGHCHRYPPQYVGDEHSSKPRWRWPVIHAGDHCGEYQPGSHREAHNSPGVDEEPPAEQFRGLLHPGEVDCYADKPRSGHEWA